LADTVLGVLSVRALAALLRVAVALWARHFLNAVPPTFLVLCQQSPETAQARHAGEGPGRVINLQLKDNKEL
jgi:hypothetical protein